MEAQDLGPILLSLQVAFAATVCTLPIAVASAWILSRKTFRGRIILETIIMAPLVLPPLVTGYLLLLLLGRNGPLGSWLDTTFGIQIAFNWLGAAVASGVLALPLMVRAIQLGFEGVDVELEGMARTLGATRIDSFFSITLPLALPGIISALMLGFARSLGEFGATIVLAGNLPQKTQTIPLAIYSAINRPGGETRAFALLFISLLLSVGALVGSYLLTRKGRLRGIKHDQRHMNNVKD